MEVHMNLWTLVVLNQTFCTFLCIFSLCSLTILKCAKNQKGGKTAYPINFLPESSKGPSVYLAVFQTSWEFCFAKVRCILPVANLQFVSYPFWRPVVFPWKNASGIGFLGTSFEFGCLKLKITDWRTIFLNILCLLLLRMIKKIIQIDYLVRS